MSLAKLPNEGDWVAVRQAIQKLDQKLGPNSNPTFATISVKEGAAFDSNVIIGGDVDVTGTGTFSTLVADSAIVIGAISGFLCYIGLSYLQIVPEPTDAQAVFEGVVVAIESMPIMYNRSKKLETEIQEDLKTGTIDDFAK